MSFVESFNVFAEKKTPLQKHFATLVAPKSDADLEQMAMQAQLLTRRYFGRAMRLFAPLYVSNECINNCSYCGFSRDNTSIWRVTLTPEEVEREACYLAGDGFRHILLVAGEHPKLTSSAYLAECVQRILSMAPSISVEVAPMEVDDYLPLVRAGAETLIAYQETYHRQRYAELHTAGPKKNFDWRLRTLERAYAAGFRRLQAGVLLGLSNWQEEAIALAGHVEYLLKNCWRSFISIGLPRLRPCAGEFKSSELVSDRDFLQLICAFRVAFPQIGISLSTREAPALRDALIPLGITMMSAGSHTEPGGYTGQGKNSLHRTVKGRKMTGGSGECSLEATGQFDIADHRPPAEIAEILKKSGMETVWKDWDQVLAKSNL